MTVSYFRTEPKAVYSCNAVAMVKENLQYYLGKYCICEENITLEKVFQKIHCKVKFQLPISETSSQLLIMLLKAVNYMRDNQVDGKVLFTQNCNIGNCDEISLIGN